jgi:hypothetical protein
MTTTYAALISVTVMLMLKVPSLEETTISCQPASNNTQHTEREDPALKVADREIDQWPNKDMQWPSEDNETTPNFMIWEETNKDMEGAVPTFMTSGFASKSESLIVKILKAIVSPSDVAQYALESTGYNTAGKVVGAGGSIVTGAVAGMVTGPVGAVVGATKSFASWGAGEMLFDAFFG